MSRVDIPRRADDLPWPIIQDDLAGTYAQGEMADQSGALQSGVIHGMWQVGHLCENRLRPKDRDSYE